MQFTQIISKKVVASDFTYPVIKYTVFLILLVYTGWVVKEKDIISTEFLANLKFHINHHLVLFLITLVLLPINWGLEALKWRGLVSRVAPLPFIAALKGVITGVALGFATPNGLGDYFGRILQLPGKDRERFIGPVFITRISQFSVTLLFGVLAFLFYLYKYYTTDLFLLYIFIFVAGLSVMFFLLVFLFHRNLLYVFRKSTFIWTYFGLLARCTTEDVLKVFALSIVRYVVFSIQFVLLLLVFGITAPLYLLFIGVFLVFLTKSIVPSLFDLGVREYAAIYFFGGMALSDEKVVLASLTLWVINILLPAIVGTALVLRVKLQRN